MAKIISRIVLLCEWLHHRSKLIEHRLLVSGAGDNVVDFEEAKARWGQGNV